MPTLLKCCKKFFGTDNLYNVLGVERDSQTKDIKKGYYKKSLKFHPDRVNEENKTEATEKFQVLGKVYSILTDKDKRAEYDETGEVDEEDAIPEDRNWVDYWRILFKKVTKEDIDDFEKNYKGSAEEIEDLKKTYCDAEGDMDFIMENMLCAGIDDEPRLTKILKTMIKDGDIPDFDAFSKESKQKKNDRKKYYKSEAAEAEEEAKKIGLDKGSDALQAMILKRQQSRESQMTSFLSDLEAKYAEPKKGKKAKKTK